MAFIHLSPTYATPMASAEALALVWMLPGMVPRCAPVQTLAPGRAKLAVPASLQAGNCWEQICRIKPDMQGCSIAVRRHNLLTLRPASIPSIRQPKCSPALEGSNPQLLLASMQ